MDSQIFLLLTLALATFFLALTGSLLSVQLAKKGATWLAIGLGFGSGFLLALGMVEMLPEAVSRGSIAYSLAIFGFALAYLVERVFRISYCPSESHSHESGQVVGTIAFLAISLHSIIDGVAIGAALLASTKLGLFVALAVMIHKIPDGFSLGMILVTKEKRRKAILILFVLFSLTTPLGALLTYFIFKKLANYIGALIGLSAGSFIYIATTHMLPEAHGRPLSRLANLQVSSSFLLGIFVGTIPFFIK